MRIPTKSTTPWVLLFTAALISIAYWLFADEFIYFMYHGRDGFPEVTAETNLYQILALGSIGIIWAVGALYYLVIDSVSLDKFWKWLLVLLFTVGITFLFCYNYPLNVFENITVNGSTDPGSIVFSMDILNLSLLLIPVNVVLFIIMSIGLEGFSTNCGRTPF